MTPHQSTGFTLVELVVVILLLGILSAYVAPRFLARADFDAIVAREDLKQSLRFAQQLAMSRTDAGVVFTAAANQVTVTVGGVVQPGYPLALPSGLSLTAAAITFNHLGAATGGNVALQIAGGAQTPRVCVEAATGYAYDC